MYSSDSRPRRQSDGSGQRRTFTSTPRHKRSGNRDARPERSARGSSDPRPPRAYSDNRVARPPRTYAGGREARPEREFTGNRETRSPRAYAGNRDARSEKRFERPSSDSRPARSYSSARPEGRSGSRGGFSGGRRPAGRGGFSENRNRGGGRRMPTFNPSQFINTNPIEEKAVAYVPKNTFETFGLDPALSRTVIARGITTPTPIQDQIIPEIMQGRDVIGLAETGTGKTAAFLLPLIEKTLHDDNRQTLILTPTRELALQIQDEMRNLSHGFRLFSTLCVGGTNIYPQIKGLGRKNHFIIGTPGRVLDLIKRNILKPERVRTVVLDEADRMLDMGFINDMRAILANTPKERETLLFSATMTREAEKLVNDFMNNPVSVSVKKKDVTNSIEQDVVPFEHHTKFDTLANLLVNPDLKRVIIFGSMKHSVEKLAQELTAHGIKAESIHGNKTHGARQRALAAFKSGNARVLVATDVAARGIHVDGVSHVINYDLPGTFEDYVHRIGRTGRGDKKGKALTFIPKFR